MNYEKIMNTEQLAQLKALQAERVIKEKIKHQTNELVQLQHEIYLETISLDKHFHTLKQHIKNEVSDIELLNQELQIVIEKLADNTKRYAKVNQQILDLEQKNIPLEK